MKKHLYPIVLAIVLALAVTGCSKLKQEDFDALNLDLSKAQETVAQLEGDLSAAREEAEGLKQQLADASKEKESLESEKQSLEAENQTLTEEKSALEADKQTLEAEKASLEEQLAEAQKPEEKPEEKPSESEPEDQPENSADEPSDEPAPNEDFSVKEYMYESSSYTYCYLVIKNNTDQTVSIHSNGIARDADGKMIGADDCGIAVLAPGEESITDFAFSDVTGVASVDYDLQTSEPDYYSPVLSQLTMEESVNPGNVIVMVTNTGEEAAQHVEVHALFFDADGNVVYHRDEYAGDSDLEIKPGASSTVQLDCRGSFDHVEVYLTGYHWAW